MNNAARLGVIRFMPDSPKDFAGIAGRLKEKLFVAQRAKLLSEIHRFLGGTVHSVVPDCVVLLGDRGVGHQPDNVLVVQTRTSQPAMQFGMTVRKREGAASVVIGSG